MTTNPPWTRSAELLDRAIDRVAGADDLDGIAERVAAWSHGAFHGAVPRSTLSGTATGHPLHPPLTDVTIGLLMSATLLDLVVPRRWGDRAVTTLLATGLVMAVPTAMAGLHDWTDTSGAARRVGFVHGGSNVVAMLLYTFSLVTRLRGGTVLPRLCSGLAFLLMTVAGFLGGDLAYRRGIGVDHTAFDRGPREWTPAIVLDDLPLRELHAVTVQGTDLALFRTYEGVFAVVDRCSHLGGPLSDGEVDESGFEVSCPWHASRFRLADGRVTRGPATAPQPAFHTRVVEGIVEVRAHGRS